MNVFVMIGVCLSLFLFPYEGIFGADPEVVAKAKSEEKLVWYTSTAIDDVVTIIKAFKEKYPFLDVKPTRGGTDQTLRRVDNEAKAGFFQADVIDINGLYSGVMLEKGYWSSYFSPEEKDYPKELKDPKGRWHSIFLLTLLPSYNTRLVPSKDAPKSWEDLLNPKWKDKLAIVDTGVLFYAGVKSYWGEESGEKYLQRLRAQRPAVTRGFTLIVQGLAAGEFPIAVTSYGHRVEQFISKGAPIDWVKSDVVFSISQLIGVTGQGKSPNAAKLLVDFLVSQEGQKILRQLQRIPSHPKVDPVPARLTRGVRLHHVPITENANDYSRMGTRYRQLFVE